MFGLQLFLQRRRKVLVRYGAIALVGAAVIAVALPRADAHDVHAQTVAANDQMSVLFSPEPVSGKRFGMFYGLPHS